MNQLLSTKEFGSGEEYNCDKRYHELSQTIDFQKKVFDSQLSASKSLLTMKKSNEEKLNKARMFDYDGEYITRGNSLDNKLGGQKDVDN